MVLHRQIDMFRRKEPLTDAHRAHLRQRPAARSLRNAVGMIFLSIPEFFCISPSQGVFATHDRATQNVHRYCRMGRRLVSWGGQEVGGPGGGGVGVRVTGGP